MSNIEISEGEVENTYYVTTDITAENGQERIICQVVATVGKNDDTWILYDYAGTNVSDRIPLAVREPDVALIENVIKKYYPEINWGYTQSRFLMNDLDYNFPITLRQKSRDTRLEEKIDSLVYEYSFDTYTAHVSGLVAIDLIYTIQGEWEVDMAEVQFDELEWKLETSYEKSSIN